MTHGSLGREPSCRPREALGRPEARQVARPRLGAGDRQAQGCQAKDPLQRTDGQAEVLDVGERNERSGPNQEARADNDVPAPIPVAEGPPPPEGQPRCHREEKQRGVAQPTQQSQDPDQRTAKA